MGLKEEMEGDVAAAPIGALKVSVRKKPAAESADAALVHKHGTGLCEQTYVDDDGRRRTTLVQGRIPKYVANCKACVAEDVKRMAAPAAADLDFDSTVFLIPERAPDSNIVLAYLAQRYPGHELAALDTIRPSRLALRKGAQIVVVTRRVLPGEKFVGPSSKPMEDRFGNIVDVAIPHETYIPEIVESAPVVVDDCVKSTAATMFSDAQVDLTELCAQLCDVASPRYFIAQYKRIVGSDEIVFTLRQNG